MNWGSQNSQYDVQRRITKMRDLLPNDRYADADELVAFTVFALTCFEESPGMLGNFRVAQRP